MLGNFYVDTLTNTMYGPKVPPDTISYGPSIRAHPPQVGATSLTNQSLGTRATVVSTTGARAIALRFYKTAGGVAGASRSLRLYKTDGTLLASTTTSNETAGGGWQEAALATPVTIAYNTGIVMVYDWPLSTDISFAGTAASSASTVITYQGSQYQGAIGGFPPSTGSSPLMADVVLQVLTVGAWPMALKSAP